MKRMKEANDSNKFVKMVEDVDPSTKRFVHEDGNGNTTIINLKYEDSGTHSSEAGGMANEDDCLFCALKHVSTAYALWNEFMGAPEYRLEFIMSLGELRAAELHLVQNYPEWCVAVRELRLGIEEGEHLFKEFRELMRGIADKAGIFYDDMQKTSDNG